MNRHTVSICVASLGLLAGLASGQGDAPRAMSGSFDQPLSAAAEADGVKYSSTFTDGGDTFRLEIDKGVRTVTHNGEKVPESKLRSRSGRLQVLGDDDKVLCEFDLPSRSGASRNRDRNRIVIAPQPREPAPAAPQPPEVPEMVREQPRVMLGIRMNQDEEGRLEVTRVISGLAAEAAGVEEGDVLVTLDGKGIENLSSIRSILHEKQPGDAVDLVVHRDGKDVTLTLRLQAYEAQKLSGAAPAEDGGWGGSWNGNAEAGAKWAAEAQKSIEMAIAEIQKSKNTEKLRAEITRSLESAIEAIKSAKAEGMGELQSLGPAMVERFRGLQHLQGQSSGSGGPRSFVFSAPNDAPADQMKALQDKLDKLQDRLDQLNEKIDKLVEKH